MTTKRMVGNYIYVKCSCGDHLIDLLDLKWNDKKLGFYHCNGCDKPLICRGEDGHFYYVGEKIK